METLIFGHRSPDTDSVASALTLSNLKNILGDQTTPCMLGDMNKETKYILDYFNIEAPKRIENVKTQIKDMNYDKILGIPPNESILQAYRLMEDNKIRILPIVDKEQKLLGIVTMKDIAMTLIQGDVYHIHTTIKNIVEDLQGEILYSNKEEVEGTVSVLALYSKTLKNKEVMDRDTIAIVGDRFDIIEHAIESGVCLIILTNNVQPPEVYIEKAKEKGVNIIRVPRDTYSTSKLINQCNYISSIMISDNIIKFDEEEYLDDTKEEISSQHHTNYPIIDVNGKYLGMMNKRHLLYPDKKKVILVDHNEYGQSARGLDQAEILEIVDHHKLGDISTTMPIHFRNMPVGSTCTIVYHMYLENNVKLDKENAGLLLGGILSDTLALKSPTTTHLDREAVEKLNRLLNLDIQEFSTAMFKAGSSLEGQSAEEIFNKDYKAFNIDGKALGVAQVFTMDIDEVFARKEEILNYIKVVHNSKDHFLTILIITDIIQEGSYILYQSQSNNLISISFNVEEKQGVFVKGVVSRKKQVIPKLTQGINMIK